MDQYELLDFGRGRKLERLGGLVLDRPSPAADGFDVVHAAEWERSDARYVRGQGAVGKWHWTRPSNRVWSIRHGSVAFELKPTEFGHVGVFPEQAANWDWIDAKLSGASRTVKVLNLFAYTGGSTFAAASAGVEVVHLDAAKNIVHWARKNAGNSGLVDAPIRWIVEDARRFVERELRRGNQYDAIILDPPSYSHGPQGEIWKIELLPELLTGCGALLSGAFRFVLLTLHSKGLTPSHLTRLAKDSLGSQSQGRAEAKSMHLRTRNGRQLHSGESLCWLPQAEK